MKQIVNDIVNKLHNSRVQFGDVRFTSNDSELFYFEKGELKNYTHESNHNTLGIRVLTNGAWGFCGLNEFTPAAIDQAIDRAIQNARHAALFRREKIQFPPLPATTDSYTARPLEDPFDMPRNEKIEYLSHIAGLAETGNPKIVFNVFRVVFNRQYKIYANTEGTFTDSLIYETYPLLQELSSNGQEVMTRTCPFDMSPRPGGFEIVRHYHFEDNISRCIEEAIQLLDAPRIEEEHADLIIGKDQLALQLHESVGHATEADRIFGMEISYAGKTFVRKEMLGSFRYGSPAVNIVSDSTSHLGLGYHPVDDEGVPGQQVDIVKNGILVGLQTSREVAALLGTAPSSNMRSTCGYDFPLVRMTNFCLLPGNAGLLKDLIGDTENGYYIDGVKSWSIDDNRYNFQFTTEIGWKIQNGEITGVVKEPTYYGITPEFWNSCDAVCSEEEWEYMGVFNCGKGEPGQEMHLSHGVAPARFRKVACNIRA